MGIEYQTDRLYANRLLADFSDPERNPYSARHIALMMEGVGIDYPFEGEEYRLRLVPSTSEEFSAVLEGWRRHADKSSLYMRAGISVMMALPEVQPEPVELEQTVERELVLA